MKQDVSMHLKTMGMRFLFSVLFLVVIVLKWIDSLTQDGA